MKAFLIGLGAGATVALLFAPRTGKETQRAVSKFAKQGMDHAMESGKKMSAQVKDLADQAKEFPAF